PAELARLRLTRSVPCTPAAQALMRQQDDHDCRIVARDIFSGLANSAECKPLIAQSMRG
ncbi:hypothetical protein TSOC_010254, partial [Tetrabaena socialis]